MLGVRRSRAAEGCRCRPVGSDVSAVSAGDGTSTLFVDTTQRGADTSPGTVSGSTAFPGGNRGKNTGAVPRDQACRPRGGGSASWHALGPAVTPELVSRLVWRGYWDANIRLRRFGLRAERHCSADDRAGWPGRTGGTAVTRSDQTTPAALMHSELALPGDAGRAQREAKRTISGPLPG